MPKEINLLIHQCKKGNQKAQMQVYDLYCEAMYTVACRYLSDEEAKDAMQEAFLKAFLKIDSYVKTATFGSWLKRIVINQCIDELKKRKLETVYVDKYSLEVIDDDDWMFDIVISKQEIIDAIEELSKTYQLVVKLYLIEGYDHTEISEILKIPIKTSRTQLRRGKLQLRELLKLKKNEARY